jgi:outer membrane protein OmpA-like peptidoglycan-associated protein
MSSRALILPALICAAALSGCLTPRIQPQVSQAVVQARAAAGAKSAACPTDTLATLSPVLVAFGFNEATVPEVGDTRLAAAVKWLGCNPGVEVVISPEGDSHADAAHLNDLAQRRAQAVAERLRSLGATAPVIHTLARGAPDPVSAPHLVIKAQGRGW